eukprot:gene12080-13324_t
MLPFKRNKKIHERYTLLSAPVNVNLDSGGKEGSERSTGEEYACFLRSLTAPTIDVNNDDQITAPPIRSKTANNEIRTKENHNKKSTGITAVLQIKAKNDESHKKRLKMIEDHMWQHKQEERELKRTEGDIIKKQRMLTKTMQDYESTVYKKQREEELFVMQASNDLERLKQDVALQDGKLTRQKIDRNITEIQKSKDRERKAVTIVNAKTFQYEKIAEEVRKKKLEVENMTREFEEKMRMKEEEEFKLEKEMAEIAITINMEVQKQRVLKADGQKERLQSLKADKQENRKREDDYNAKLNEKMTRASMADKRQQKLEKEVGTTLNHTALKIREEGRKLTDVKSRLQANSQFQREAQSDANHASFNRQALDSEEKIKLVDARRAEIQNIITKERKQRGAQVVDEWKGRYFEKTNEMKRREVEDNMKHLQKFVSKQEELEQMLYNQVKACESERRKQEQNVENIRQELLTTKKDNAKLLKETALRCQKQEEELMQKLSREEAALKKALSEREERIRSFVKQRGFYQEEKDMLGREQKIHDRLHRIGQKSDLMMEQEMY